MHKPSSSRRDFLRASAALTCVALSASAAQEPPGQGPKIEHRRFGKTDMYVALLGFGGAEIGFEKTEQGTVERLLNSALDAGLNVVDTAECYVESELQIGAAIGHRRKEFHLFTKVGHNPVEGDQNSDWSKPAILRSIERSLTRLKTDVIDLVHLHSCGIEELERGDCIEALEQAKKEGKTRYIGYSGDSKAALKAIELGRFDSLQTSVNFCDQECIELTLPLAKEKQMGVVAKRPIANAVWRHDAKPPSAYHHEYWQRLQELKYEFATGDARSRQDADGPAGIAMRFAAMQPAVSVLIVGTTKPERWKQNADLMRAGPLDKALHDSIRARWKAVAKPGWVGQI